MLSASRWRSCEVKYWVVCFWKLEGLFTPSRGLRLILWCWLKTSCLCLPKFWRSLGSHFRITAIQFISKIPLILMILSNYLFLLIWRSGTWICNIDANESQTTLTKIDVMEEIWRVIGFVCVCFPVSCLQIFLASTEHTWQLFSYDILFCFPEKSDSL